MLKTLRSNWVGSTFQLNCPRVRQLDSQKNILVFVALRSFKAATQWKARNNFSNHRLWLVHRKLIRLMSFSTVSSFSSKQQHTDDKQRPPRRIRLSDQNKVMLHTVQMEKLLRPQTRWEILYVCGQNPSGKHLRASPSNLTHQMECFTWIHSTCPSGKGPIDNIWKSEGPFKIKTWTLVGWTSNLSYLEPPNQIPSLPV